MQAKKMLLFPTYGRVTNTVSTSTLKDFPMHWVHIARRLFIISRDGLAKG